MLFSLLFATVALIDTNLERLRENLQVTQENIEVLESEIEELSGLEKKHVTLKTELENSLEKSLADYRQNEAVLQDLGKADSLKARAEKNQRISWKSLAERRLTKSQNAMHELSVNLRQVQSRKQPLGDQLLMWKTRRSDLERSIAELEAVKAPSEAKNPRLNQ